MKTIRFAITALLLSGFLLAAEDKIKFDTLLDYKNVTVTKVEPDGIRIMHESGAAKIPIEKIPEDIRKQLGMNEDAAKAHREVVRAQEQKAAVQDQKQQLLATKRLIFKGSVFQVADGGLLLRNVSYTDGTIRKVEKKIPYKVQTGGPNAMYPNAKTTYETRYKTEWVEVQDVRSFGENIIFVECDTSGYVDRSVFSGTVYPNGTYAYTSLIGARNTIPAYTTDASKVLRAAGLEP
jgi:hypothetical protein